MKNRFNLLCIGLMLVSCLSACVGTNSNNSESPKLPPVDAPNLPSTLIQESELVSLGSSSCYNTSDSLKVCSKDNIVCATLKACPTASYAPGGDGHSYWLQKEFAGTGGTSLTLSFATNVAKDFHITDIYNDLQERGVIGKIVQIDTANCDALIASGNTAGKNCNIEFMYEGLVPNSVLNTIHFIFGSKSNNNLNFDFGVKVSNTLSTIQGAPIINSLGEDSDYITYINPIDDDGNVLRYSNQYMLMLTNNGIGVLKPDSDVPNIQVNVGSKFKTVNQLTIPNAMNITSCDYASVNYNGVCQFPFNNTSWIITNQFDTQFVRLIFNYRGFNGNRVQYTQPVAIGVGDIATKDYDLSFSSIEREIVLEKKNYSSDYISYDIQLKNFKLYAVANPNINLYTRLSKDGQKLEYAYGDYQGKFNPLSLNDYINKIQFQYDKECFENGFDINQESQDAQKTLCKIKLILPSDIEAFSKVLSFQLYASYEAPTGDTVKQLIGNVSINDDYPDVNASLCTAISWRNNVVQCTYKSKYWQGYGPVDGTGTIQFDYLQCAQGSSVEQRVIQEPIRGNGWEFHGYYDKPELYCQHYK